MLQAEVWLLPLRALNRTIQLGEPSRKEDLCAREYVDF